MIVDVGSTGQVTLCKRSGSADVVDVDGWFTSALAARRASTSTSTSTSTSASTATLLSQGTAPRTPPRTLGGHWGGHCALVVIVGPL